MDEHEHLSWKAVYLAAIFSLLIMGITYYFISPSDTSFFTEEKTERIAEFQTIRVIGRKEGKKNWELTAASGWTTSDRDTTYLDQLSDGKIYLDGELVLTNLRAPKARAFRKSEVVEAFGFVNEKRLGQSQLTGLLNLGKISDPKSTKRSEWTRLRADFLKYIPAEKRSEMNGDVILVKRNSTIYAQDIKIFHGEKRADIFGELKLERQDGVLTADRLQYFSEEERLVADGQVLVNIQEGKVKTNLKANHASFFSETDKGMTLDGSVEARQGKKVVVANQGQYSSKDKKLALQGSVKAIFSTAGAILKEDSAAHLKNPEAREILREKTLLTSDQLALATDSGNARAFGSVLVTQKGREAKAEQADYDDKSELLTLSGNVYMKKKAEWVSAKQVIVSVKNETFEALGAVEAEIKL